MSAFTKSSTAEEVTRGIDLRDQTILVTGVTSGIGLETMRILALRGAHVIGTGRTLEKARSACSTAVGRTTPIAMSLDDYTSVVVCAGSVLALVDRLDCIICNAGVMGLSKLEQVAGVERHFAVNHLGHFLLTHRLLRRICEAPQGRIVVVSSSSMTWASPRGIEWDNLSGARDYSPSRAYGQSKLANALFSLGLARRLYGSRATSNSLHPGYVNTDLFRHYPRSLRGPRGVISNKASVGHGAATSCYLATAPLLSQTSGYHFSECNPIRPDGRAQEVDAARRLWDVSATLLQPYLA